ncbi:MAG TPA: hypothetical protein VFY90_09795 [Tepidiformaceae bacterium]|nr:hypothetical protein [Tepidiformaceae bacterium]
MATIRGIDGKSAELLPLDYEFPEPSREMRSDDDANWLTVRLTLTHGDWHWQAHHPCLYTWSLLGISRWLRAVADGTAEKLWYYPSIEQNLALNWDGDEPLVVLRLLLSQELRLPHTDQFELHVRPGAFRRFADGLERDIEPFPIRTWGEDAATERIARRFRRELLRL